MRCPGLGQYAICKISVRYRMDTYSPSGPVYTTEKLHVYVFVSNFWDLMPLQTEKHAHTRYLARRMHKLPADMLPITHACYTPMSSRLPRYSRARRTCTKNALMQTFCPHPQARRVELKVRSHRGSDAVKFPLSLFILRMATISLRLLGHL